MNKLAYYQGYMEKKSDAATSALSSLLRKHVVLPGAIVGAPIVGGYLGGRAYSALKEPTNQEVGNIQADYVKQKFQQAIDDLEKRKKIERLQEQNLGNAHSLRI